MPKVQLQLGAALDVINADEMEAALHKQGDIEEERARARARGISVLRLPQVQGIAATGALLMGAGQQISGPRDGFVWYIKRFFVTGLAAGDVVLIYANGVASQPLWQLTAAVPQATFGTYTMFLREGETLVVANMGTFTSTAQITLSGDVLQVPTVMLGKLV